MSDKDLERMADEYATMICIREVAGVETERVPIVDPDKRDAFITGYRAAQATCDHKTVDGDICCACGKRVDRIDGNYIASKDQSGLSTPDPEIVERLKIATEALEYILNRGLFSERLKWGNEFLDVARTALAKIKGEK